MHSLHVWDHAAVTMESLFESFDLFLSPTTADTAPKITADLQSDLIRQQMADVSHLSADEGLAVVSAMFEESLTITPYTQLANLTGQPAISLPTHVSEQGLPLEFSLWSPEEEKTYSFRLVNYLKNMVCFIFRQESSKRKRSTEQMNRAIFNTE